MADKSNQLILTALSRAAAAASAAPLYARKNFNGLFPANSAGKQAAQRCQEDGYLHLVATEPAAADNGDSGGAITLVKKKTAGAPLCTLTEKGLAYLLSQVSPRHVLEDFVRALETRRQQADDLLDSARQMQQSIDAVKANVDKVLQQTCKVENTAASGGDPSNLKALFAGFLSESVSSPSTPAASGSETALLETVRAELTRWQQTGASEDCPLPHLYRQTQARTIGQFHDVLRQLHDNGTIYLHPWTGPLYDIPEPPYALLIGHEVAYYASIRK